MPSLDGHASATGSATTSYTVTLTTSQTADVVIVAVATSNYFGNPSATVTGVSDTAGLTWAQRLQSTTQVNGNNTARLTVYWAYSSGMLSSDVITVTTSSGGSVEDVAISAFGVHGVLTPSSAPFDPHASLPNVVLGNGGGGLSATVSTANGDDMVLSLHASRDNPGQAFYPSGFTVIDNTWDSAQSAVVTTAYKVVTGSGSGTYTTQSGDTSSTPLVFAIDALKGGAPLGGGLFPGSLMLLGVGA